MGSQQSATKDCKQAASGIVSNMGTRNSRQRQQACSFDAHEASTAYRGASLPEMCTNTTRRVQAAPCNSMQGGQLT